MLASASVLGSVAAPLLRHVAVAYDPVPGLVDVWCACELGRDQSLYVFVGVFARSEWPYVLCLEVNVELVMDKVRYVGTVRYLTVSTQSSRDALWVKDVCNIAQC